MVLTCTCRHSRKVLLKETLFWMSSERGEGKIVQNNCKDDLRDEKDLKVASAKMLDSPFNCLEYAYSSKEELRIR